ncbi:WEB family protein At3g02930, chloroplastic-like [Phalaenopsis equestris]|uniref:WEB family protein At3g02930, chloroplastic-like n=1 Tax=Phalaenopsis equestris TaxID=78828 RepID=UPI0009E325AC|nr:WEB family protein At3g02930, chloroplastic-like [Phalaenopsis equestris]
MLSSKSKSSMSDSSSNKSIPATPRSINKSTPATPRVSKNGRLGSAKVDPNSPSPQQKLRTSVERSPGSVNSKSTADHRLPRISTPPDKQPRTLKESELQTQLTLAQEDLKMVKEKLAFEEKEKARALEELIETKKAVEEANEKLEDALLSQKLAEESSELDKFRADEVEQSAIEAAQKREEEWQEEFGHVRSQHAVDVAALVSATQELQMVKQELLMTTEAKNSALGHAEDAMKIAEVHVGKVEALSAEISRLNSLLDSMFESHSKETAEIINKFDYEAEVLKHELGKAKAAEEKLVDAEALVEVLKVQLFDAKMSESNALSLVDEQKKKVELLQFQLEEANRSESELKHYLASVIKQLEETEVVCNDAKSEMNSLNAKVEALELELATYKEDLKESDQKLELAMQEVLDFEKKAEVLKFEIQKVEEEKEHALNNEKIACLNVENLTQENTKLAVELEITKEESGKAKKAMESLASALHEFSIETKDAQERLLIKQGQLDIASAEAEQLKTALKNEQEKYEHILDEAKYEIICLKKMVEKSEAEAKELRLEWDLKEHSLISVIQKSEKEIASIKLQKDNAVESLEKQKDEAKLAEKEASKLVDQMRLVEAELISTKNSMEEMMAETSNLKERLLDKENELQNITQENDELRIRDAAASEKIKELSERLTELTTSNSHENEEHGENRELLEFDLPPMSAEAMPEKISESKTEESRAPFNKEEMLKKDTTVVEIDNANGKTDENHNGHGNVEEEVPVRMEVKLCEGDNSSDKQLSSVREDNTESVDDDIDPKIVINNHLDHVNGEKTKTGDNASPDKQRQQQQKKKKALLLKLGSILKKKSNPK